MTPVVSFRCERPGVRTAAKDDAAFARELPRLLAAIWRVFNEYELTG